MALGLQGLDKLNLVLRCNPGKDIGAQGRILQLLFGKTVKVTARHGALSLRQQTELATNCLGGHRMVACYHFNRNSGRMADPDGVHRLGSGWVDHAEQTCKLQTTADSLRLDLVRRDVFLVRKGDHPHALAGVSGHGVIDSAQLRFAQGTAFKDSFRGAFQEDVVIPVNLVQGGHEFTVRLEGDNVQAGMVTAEILAR